MGWGGGFGLNNKTPIRAYPWDEQTINTNCPVTVSFNCCKTLKFFVVKTLIINFTKFANANIEALLGVIRIGDT